MHARSRPDPQTPHNPWGTRRTPRRNLGEVTPSTRSRFHFEQPPARTRTETQSSMSTGGGWGAKLVVILFCLLGYLASVQTLWRPEPNPGIWLVGILVLWGWAGFLWFLLRRLSTGG